MKSTHGLALMVLAGAFAGSSAMAHPTYELGKGSVKGTPKKQVRSAYVPAPELMPFSDNFDSYANGAAINTVGNGWQSWAAGSATAKVTNAKFASAPNSMSTTALSDDVQLATLGQITSGKWKLSGKVYLPASASGTGGGWFIGLNSFLDVSGVYNWSVQIGFDTAAAGPGLIGNSGQNSTPIPMVFDKWIPTEIYIDLDADTVWAQVDTGSGFQKVIDPPSSWTAGASGGGKQAIECWDMYSGGAVGFLYDDLNFGPDAPTCYPDCDGSGTLDIDDFICFQTFFAIGDPYADCDASGTLNIDDFICFQTFFAIGC
jgi:hypothetical protein